MFQAGPAGGPQRAGPGTGLPRSGGLGGRSPTQERPPVLARGPWAVRPPGQVPVAATAPPAKPVRRPGWRPPVPGCPCLQADPGVQPCPVESSTGRRTTPQGSEKRGEPGNTVSPPPVVTQKTMIASHGHPSQRPGKSTWNTGVGTLARRPPRPAAAAHPGPGAGAGAWAPSHPPPGPGLLPSQSPRVSEARGIPFSDLIYLAKCRRHPPMLSQTAGLS